MQVEALYKRIDEEQRHVSLRLARRLNVQSLARNACTETDMSPTSMSELPVLTLRSVNPNQILERRRLLGGVLANGLLDSRPHLSICLLKANELNRASESFDIRRNMEL